ncbi:hypothetical protein BDI4_540010 [Burkholderia diffusa]|nr:hypothetical protein BDI4_540010 [Burkholderia diffusa]
MHSIRLADEQFTEPTMLCGFDDDLAAQVTQTSNRIRDLLTQIHPALDRVVGPHLDHPAVLDLLERYPSPSTLAAAGDKTLANHLTKLALSMGKNLAAKIFPALNEQAVIVPGTQAATTVMPRLARQLAALLKQA